MSIKSNIRKIKSEVPENVTIIGVTKYVDAKVAKELFDSGITHLGENRPDVFLEKYSEIKGDVTWHFIGTLQTRKVKNVINKIDYLHSLDRLSLAEEIQKRAAGKVKCFVQVNIVEEENKHGLMVEEVLGFIKEMASYDKIEVIGLMTMAPFTNDEQVIRDCFASLRGLQKKVLTLDLPHAPCKELSMGMSDDYQIAIEFGATFVRLGRCLIN